MNVEEYIVKNVAFSACGRVSKQVRLSLQRTKEGMQSGDDSGLNNVWEEMCVQVQEGPSPVWEAYVHTVHKLVAKELKSLQRFEMEAIWLQTASGSEWALDYGEDMEGVPVIEDEVINHVMEHFLYADAENWSNKRIRVYLDR